MAPLPLKISQDFTITFTSFADGVQITNLETGPTCCTSSQTMFCSGTLTPWAPLLSNVGATVTFTAPGSQMLLPGDSFYINIYFSGDEGSSRRILPRVRVGCGLIGIPEEVELA